MFDASQTPAGVLRSDVYLTTRHTPETPVGREQQLQRIADAVRPLTKRRSPENLLIHGPAGVGKTTCVRHVFDQLEEETTVEPVYINCWRYNTRPSFLSQLLIELGYPVPRKGKPVDELLAKLREWLDKTRGVAVALDEFDQLRAQTEVVYDLQQLSADADSSLGMLLVSNQHPTTIELDPRSESRLTCHTLKFSPYTADELGDILEQRVEQAFRPDAVDADVITAVAEEVAAQSGDCREAFDLLLEAGRTADRDGANRVTMETLDAVR
jgi:cell division control protein 6